MSGGLLNVSDALLSSNHITLKTEIWGSVVGDLLCILTWVNVVPGVVGDLLGL